MSLQFADVGAGGPCDVCWHDGRILVAFQSGRDTNVFVVVKCYDATLKELWALTYNIGDDAGAFPRLLSAHGTWWLLYREGASLGGRAVLRKGGVRVWTSDSACGGNDPVCLGGNAFAWQRFGDNRVTLHDLTTCVSFADHAGRPTGLSHIHADGQSAVLVDDALTSVLGITRPSWAGLLVCGEHPQTGVEVQYYDRRLHLWPALPTYTPRLSADRGLYACATWNANGVLLATFTLDDLTTPAAPPAPPAPWPPGLGWTTRDDITEIDVVDYLLGAEWSRNGMHVAADAVTYSHPFQARSGTGWVQHTKFNAPDTRAATWTYTDQWVGLAFDGTNELTGGYRFVTPGTTTTAPLYPRRMRVGKAHAHTTRVDVLNLAEQTRRTITFTGYVEAVYDGPAVGSLPATTHALIVFEPASDDTRGWRELNIGAKGHGCWYWHQVRKADGAQPDMRWIGTTDAPRVPDIPVQYATALPAAPIVAPPPTTPEEPPVRMWAYNDADAVKIIDFLALKYTTPTDAGGLGRTEVDHLGYARWLHDAVRLLDGGASVTSALREINRRINQIVGLPIDAWPGDDAPYVPETPPPTTGYMRGRLRIANGVFADDAGPVLPVFCHLGDGLSRFTRDPGGTLATLDSIAAAGYDGVRTWTVLGGSSYWNGREVGPLTQGDAYWHHVDAFVDALAERGLRWLVSQGDMLRLHPTRSGRVAFMQTLARVIANANADVVCGVDAGNEAWQNGESDAEAMREAVEAFRAVVPCDVWSLTSPPSEETADLDRYSGSVYDVHGYRDARHWDKVRHIFSIGYEGKPARRLGIQSEPFGYGDLVSASANKHELTAGVMSLAVAVSLLSRQAWVYFSGPGVKSDAGQRLEDMPGFRETCAVRAQLPRDLMTYGTLVHGGTSQRGRRVFAVPGTDETRADHALHADGRFICVRYGPRWQDVTQERAATIEQRISCGNDGEIILGRVA